MPIILRPQIDCSHAATQPDGTRSVEHNVQEERGGTALHTRRYSPHKAFATRSTRNGRAVKASTVHAGSRRTGHCLHATAPQPARRPYAPTNFNLLTTSALRFDLCEGGAGGMRAAQNEAGRLRALHQWVEPRLFEPGSAAPYTLARSAGVLPSCWVPGGEKQS